MRLAFVASVVTAVALGLAAPADPPAPSIVLADHTVPLDRFVDPVTVPCPAEPR